MQAIITYPEKKEHIQALKAFLTALSIKFEDEPESNLTTKIKQEKEKKIDGEIEIYNPEFLAKIKKSRKDYKDGNFITVEKQNFKTFLGIE